MKEITIIVQYLKQHYLTDKLPVRKIVTGKFPVRKVITGKLPVSMVITGNCQLGWL